MKINWKKLSKHKRDMLVVLYVMKQELKMGRKMFNHLRKQILNGQPTK